MNCQNHPTRSGVNTCSMCGEWLCDECSVDVDNRIICKGCIAKLAGGKTAKPREAASDCARPGGRYISGLLLFMTSALPGTNYMYLGLMKRGLLTLSAFFLCIYFTGLVSAFGFLIPVIWITSFFDGFRIRRKMMEGGYVEDDITDIKSFLADHKKPIVSVGAVIIVLSVFSSVIHHAARFGGFALHSARRGAMMYADRGCSGLIPFVVIAIGVYFLIKAHHAHHGHGEGHRHHGHGHGRCHDRHDDSNHEEK